eukprot:gb/GFBE01045904.1/.p1 GENE.gb/GFBE01045904.1/~~gb/GFBE01045904.1/.p1  ORF type:complete len:939 (+),score=168.98 gb/GFBE01045904.1/:1-2817(+)
MSSPCSQTWNETDVARTCAQGTCTVRLASGCLPQLSAGVHTQLVSIEDPQSLGLAGEILLASHSSLSAKVSTNFGQKSAELRDSQLFFAEWLVQERGGIRLGGQNYSLGFLYVDDDAQASQAAPALAYAIARSKAQFAVGGYSSSLTANSAAEARANNVLMVTSGASAPSIFEASGAGAATVFGFLPLGHMYDEALFRAVVHMATELDAGRTSLPRGAKCLGGNCAGSLRMRFLNEDSSCDYALPIAEQYLGSLTVAQIELDAGQGAYEEVLRQCKADGITLVFLCSKQFEFLDNVVKALESVDYSPYALLAKGLAVSDTYREKVRSGWWQGSYVLDTVAWDSEEPEIGHFSQMSSGDFSERFNERWGYQPSYLAAAQFSALSALVTSIETSNSLDVDTVARTMRSLNLSEFYTRIQFNEFGQIDFLPRVQQVPAPFHSSDDHILDYFRYKTVWPGPRQLETSVFPLPSWAFRRCSVLKVDSSGQECYGHGSCSTLGICECTNGWTGDSCEVPVEPEGALTIIALCTLAAVLVILVAGACCLVWRYFRRRHRRRQDEALAKLDAALWDQDREAVSEAQSRLRFLGYSYEQMMAETRQRTRAQSEAAGVSVAYLLSQEFLDLARSRTANEDPTFYDLKDAFLFDKDPIGKEAVCPRDGERGCALIDTLPAKYRRPCTHFLSWTWGYKLSVVRDALSVWISNENLQPEDVFLFMCFFVNNQYRIIGTGQQVSAEELEETFEGNLRRISRVVALLDTWNNPRYLQRIWTIFEQLVAIKLEVPVTMVLTAAAGAELIEQFEAGKEGICRVMAALTKVDSENAEAYVPADADAVKALILQYSSFQIVNSQIVDFMLRWMSLTFEAHMKTIMVQQPDRKFHKALSLTVENCSPNFKVVAMEDNSETGLTKSWQLTPLQAVKEERSEEQQGSKAGSCAGSNIVPL